MEQIKIQQDSLSGQRARPHRLTQAVVHTADWVSGPQEGGPSLSALCKGAWILFWMRWAGRRGFGRTATRLATWFAPPYRARRRLAYLSSAGYLSPRATFYHPDLRLGRHVFIDDDVVIYQGDPDGGVVELGDQVAVYRGSFLETGAGGHLTIGAHTTIHPGCQLKAYKAPIRIGRGVGIGQNCAFYPYDHGMAPGESFSKQPLQSKGGIQIEEDAWLGTGVIVLMGVRIGKGAVVGAGSVVWRDVPDGAVATGVPARVIRMRNEAAAASNEGL